MFIYSLPFFPEKDLYLQMICIKGSDTLDIPKAFIENIFCQYYLYVTISHFY